MRAYLQGRTTHRSCTLLSRRRAVHLCLVRRGKNDNRIAWENSSYLKVYI